MLVDDLDAGVRTVNAYAAEHLEIQTVDAPAVAARIRSAGAIFVGAVFTGQPRRLLRGLQPRAAHRGLRAALQRAVGADVPARASTSSTTTEAALKDVSGYVITLAQAENLPAHGEAVRRRFER